MADKKQNALKFGEIVAKCWEDEAYKKRFIEDPEDVLKEAGFAVEEGVTYKVIEQPKLVKYFVLPNEDTKEAVQILSKGLLNRVEQKDHFIPEGVEVRLIQNTDDVRYLVLPASPKTLTQAELKMVAGGDSAVAISNVVAVTNGAAALEGAIVVLEGEAVSTTNVAMFEFDAAAAVVALGVIVLI